MNSDRRKFTCGFAASFAVSVLPAFRATIADDRESQEPPITCVAISSDGLYAIDGSQAGVRIRNWSDLTVAEKLDVPCRNIHDVVLSRDASKLAIIGGDPGESAWVGMYSWPSQDLLWSQSFSNDLAYVASFNASHNLLAVGCHDHSVVMLGLESGRIRSVLTGHSRPVTAVAYVGNKSTLVSCGIDQSIRVWNCDDCTEVRSLTNHTQPITCIATRPNTDDALPMVATGSDDKTVRLWQPTIGRMVKFQRLPSAVTTLAWTTDGSSIIVGCQDARIRVVQADTLQVTEQPATSDAWISAIALHPTERVMLIGDSDGNISKRSF